MKKMKMAALLMSVCMVAPILIGCGHSEQQKQSEGGGNVTENSIEKEGSTETDNAEEDVEKEVVELDIFVDQTWWPVDNFEGIFPEYITEQTGVKLNVTVAADSQQLGLMLSSGDLPDLIYTQDASRLSNAEYCYTYMSWQSSMLLILKWMRTEWL